MKNTLKSMALVFLMLFTAQCEFIDEDNLVNPNALSPEQVDPNFLLNEIQYDARSAYRTASALGGDFTRMQYMFGSTYNNAYTANSFNGIYNTAYAGLFIDTETMLEIGEVRDLDRHMGIAKILKGYVALMVVDMYGNAPYTEALQGGDNFNPALDDGSFIYGEALTLLDEGIAHMQVPDAPYPPTDLYFGHLGDVDDQSAAWIKVAKTLKLKAHLNMGNTSEVNALITEGDLILSEADNFAFRYSSIDTDPDSRHPNYSGNYDNLASAYISVGYMNILFNDKRADLTNNNGIGQDPRMRYYFYRQTTSDLSSFTPNENRCIPEFPPSHFDADDPFCIIYENNDPTQDEAPGYWGRDHLINDGIPPDGGLRTTYGIYPVGGLFDADQGASVERDDGLGGVGIEPMLMSSFTHFMIAEAELTLNTAPAAAEAALNTAIEESMNTVADFAQGNDVVGAIDAAGITAYQDYVAELYDNANAEERLEIIAKEYYIALWPNGYEAYNLMRRTGYPRDDLQPAKTASPEVWWYTLLYPSNMVERNSNVTQKERTARVFWDTKGATFDF